MRCQMREGRAELVLITADRSQPIDIFAPHEVRMTVRRTVAAQFEYDGALREKRME